MKQFDQQWALITGASSGIGKAFAEKLAREGAHLVLVARDHEALTLLAAELTQKYGITTQVIAKDLALVESPQALFEETQQLGIHVDILVNNAGFGVFGKLHQTSLEKNQKQILLNVFALSSLTQIYLKNMVIRKKGIIINIASVGSFLPLPYMSNYGASKAFVRSFTQALWAEYRHDGLKIIAVCPGPIETNFFTAMGSDLNSLAVGRKDPADVVVNDTLKALKKGKIYLIPGRLRNYWQIQILRFLPQKLIAMMSEKFMRA